MTTSSYEYEKYLNKDIFYTTNSLAQIKNAKAEDIKSMYKNNLLVKDERQFYDYCYEDMVSVKTQSGLIEVGRNLLYDLLTDKGLSLYLKNLYDNPKAAHITLVLFDEVTHFVKKTLYIDKASFSALLRFVDKDKLSPSAKDLVKYIKEKTSLKKFYKKQENIEYEQVISGQKVVIPIKYLLTVLLTDEENFFNFINSGEEKDIYFTYKDKEYRTTNKIVAYAIVDYFFSEHIQRKIVLPSKVNKRYIALANYSLIDFEALKPVESPDYLIYEEEKIENVVLDKTLEEAVINSLPKTEDKLLIAILIYLKLCEILTYDEAFYAANQKGQEAEYHENLKRISKITPRNNNVVCYEFTLIYSAFLKKYNIPHTFSGKRYGTGHIYLTLVIDNYIIKADPLETIIYNDMSNVKMNIPVSGLKSMNRNTITKSSFNNLLERTNEEYIKKQIESKPFDEVLALYKKKYVRIRLNNNEKLLTLLETLINPNLQGVDSLSYQKHIFDLIFANNDDISMMFLSKKDIMEYEYTYYPITIISISLKDKYFYYVIDTKAYRKIEKISKEEIEDNFKWGTYGYINADYTEIPGIERDNKYVR